MTKYMVPARARISAEVVCVDGVAGPQQYMVRDSVTFVVLLTPGHILFYWAFC
jgi:hypothetical protein